MGNTQARYPQANLSPRSRYHQVRVRVLSYRWGSCYPHSKTASRSTSQGCFLFQLPSLHRAGLLRKDRGAGLARIRIWGGRQRRSYHKCETRNNSRTLFISEKTDFIFSKEHDIINEVENDLFYYIEIFYNRKRSTHMGIGTH